MTNVGIERPLSQEEQKDIIDISMETAADKLRKKLITTQQEFVTANKPYCAKCARMDYLDQLENIEKEMLRKEGMIKQDKIDFKFDFKKYGDIKRFTLVKSRAEFDMVMVGNVKRQGIKVGRTDDYTCNTRGCGISVFVPLTEAEANR